MLFELDSENVLATVSRPTLTDLSCSTLAQIAQNVASTGQLFNIADTIDWLKEHPEVQADEMAADIKTILCMPIVNGMNKVIGVVQLINKVSFKKILTNVQFLFSIKFEHLGIKHF